LARIAAPLAGSNLQARTSKFHCTNCPGSTSPVISPRPPGAFRHTSSLSLKLASTGKAWEEVSISRSPTTPDPGKTLDMRYPGVNVWSYSLASYANCRPTRCLCQYKTNHKSPRSPSTTSLLADPPLAIPLNRDRARCHRDLSGLVGKPSSNCWSLVILVGVDKGDPFE
jgi:hypothetical protein